MFVCVSVYMSSCVCVCVLGYVKVNSSNCLSSKTKQDCLHPANFDIILL